MKVILLQDVPNLGSAGAIKNVSEGYARNYLIPKGLAEMATPGRVKEAEARLAAAARRLAREEQAQQALADKIEGTRIQMLARVGEQGRLYGSITAAEIAEVLTAKFGQEIDRRKIELEEPIRTVGEHQVTVHLVGRLRPTVTVVVVPEGGAPQQDGAASAAASAATEVADEESPES
ncbi:MAG: 50S ribosomal protein L9 [Sphaerobacter sp.]|nr:50S ribosomal protein L9 [Sphaerobacter sp.]